MRIAIILMVLIIALASAGMGYARWSSTLDISGSVTLGELIDCFRNVRCTEWPEALGKDVGNCAAYLVDPHTMQVTINNGYPCYGLTVDFEVTNSESIPVVIREIIIAPDNFTNGVEVSVDVLQIFEGLQIDPGSFATGQLDVHVEQAAQQNFQYTFTVTIHLAQWAPGGTMGFWKNWDRHNTFTEEEINGWLAAIDADSDWLVTDMDDDGDIDVDDMVATIEGHNKDATMEEKFLAQYLCTRLDIEAATISAGVHDISDYDPGDYLGLGGSGTLAEIIAAIEGKYGTSPTSYQYGIMHNICDALNNVEI